MRASPPPVVELLRHALAPWCWASALLACLCGPSALLERRVLDALAHVERAPDEHAAAFAGCGARALPGEFELAVTGRLELADLAGGRLGLALGADLRAALTAAAARAPHARLAEFLDEVARTRREREAALVALRILALAGDETDLERLARLGSPHATRAGALPDLREAFESALAEILARAPRAREHVEDLYRDVAAGLAEPAIRAAARARDAGALDTLADLLGVRDDFDELILIELARVAREVEPPFSAELCAAVRAELGRSSIAVRRAAAAAAAALGDVESIGILIETLQGPPELARAARAALGRLARRDLGEDAAAWVRWHERELETWLAAEARARDVASSDRRSVVESLHALGRARLFAHDAAALVAPAAERLEPDLARLACEILGELGSPRGRAALLAAQKHGQAEVRDAARAALARLAPPRRPHARGP